MEAHDASQTDGHVAVARKVEIKLHGVSSYGNPSRSSVHDTEVGGQQSVDLCANHISNQDFLGKTYHETEKPLQAIVAAIVAVTNLTFYITIAHDGTGDELREHHDVDDVVAQLLHWSVVASIGIDDIGNRLESKK